MHFFSDLHSSKCRFSRSRLLVADEPTMSVFYYCTDTSRWGRSCRKKVNPDSEKQSEHFLSHDAFQNNEGGCDWPKQSKTTRSRYLVHHSCFHRSGFCLRGVSLLFSVSLTSLKKQATINIYVNEMVSRRLHEAARRIQYYYYTSQCVNHNMMKALQVCATHPTSSSIREQDICRT